MGGVGQFFGNLLGGAAPVGGNGGPIFPMANFNQPGAGPLWQPPPYDNRPWYLSANTAPSFGQYWGQQATTTPGAYLFGLGVPGYAQFAPNPHYDQGQRPNATGLNGYPYGYAPAPVSNDIQKITGIASGLTMLLGSLGLLN